MKKQLWMAAMGLTVVAAAASAGMVTTVQVNVQLNPNLSGSAIGNMASARRSSSPYEYIGCGIQKIKQASTGAIVSYGWCQAQTASGVQGICSTSEGALLEAIQGIADYSYLSFGWDVNGYCTRILASTQSFYIP